MPPLSLSDRHNFHFVVTRNGFQSICTSSQSLIDICLIFAETSAPPLSIRFYFAERSVSDEMTFTFDVLLRELQEMVFCYLDAPDLKQMHNTSKIYRFLVDEYSLRERFIHLRWRHDMWHAYFDQGRMSLADEYQLSTHWTSIGEPSSWSHYQEILHSGSILLPDLEFLKHAKKVQIHGLFVDDWLVIEGGKHDNCTLTHFHPTASCVLRCLFPKLQLLALQKGMPSIHQTIVVLGVDWTRDHPFFAVEQDLVDYALGQVDRFLLAGPVVTFSLLSMLHEWRHLVRTAHAQQQVIEHKSAIVQQSQKAESTRSKRERELKRWKSLKTKTNARIRHLQGLLQGLIGPRWSEQFFTAAVVLQHELEQRLFDYPRPNGKKKNLTYVDERSWIYGGDTARAKTQPTPLSILDMFFENSCNARKHGTGAYRWDKASKSWMINDEDCMLRLKQLFYPAQDEAEPANCQLT